MDEMNLTDSLKLLRDYADHGNEAAFRELVERYIDLVYSTAVRRVGGDADLARDVTQAVFTDLARKARSLRNVELLGGWLHRHTGFVAGGMVRSERRRQIREQEAAYMNAPNDSPDALWQQLAPVLDETIDSLAPSDRQVILLRFFERRDFRAIGGALGISDDAAQKRVSRALEKLRELLASRGVTLGPGPAGHADGGQGRQSGSNGIGRPGCGAGIGRRDRRRRAGFGVRKNGEFAAVQNWRQALSVVAVAMWLFCRTIRRGPRNRAHQEQFRRSRGLVTKTNVPSNKHPTSSGGTGFSDRRDECANGEGVVAQYCGCGRWETGAECGSGLLALGGQQSPSIRNRFRPIALVFVKFPCRTARLN